MSRAFVFAVVTSVMLALAASWRASIVSFHGASPTARRSRLASTVAMGASEKLDAHLHVWAPRSQQTQFPYVGPMLGASTLEPPREGNVEILLNQMQAENVSGALIVQPSCHGYDHSYVTSVLRRYPSKFVGTLLANPTEGEAGITAMERLVIEDGFAAVRFNPYLWPEGRPMTDQVGRALYRRAGEMGVPVAFMAFKGLLLHLKDIEQLATDYPFTKVILDHFAFVKASDRESEEWAALLQLVRRFPQIFVKTSAFFRVSREEYPYRDASHLLRDLITQVGVQRLMWGSDWPWVEDACGYAKACSVLEVWDTELGEDRFTSKEKAWLYSKTLRSIFPTAWQPHD